MKRTGVELAQAKIERNLQLIIAQLGRMDSAGAPQENVYLLIDQNEFSAARSARAVILEFNLIFEISTPFWERGRPFLLVGRSIPEHLKR